MAPPCGLFCFLSNVIFPLLDFAVGASMILYGVLAYDTVTFEGILLPIHVGVMGLITVLFTFYIPKKVGVQIPFYLTFTGRGFVFLFYGGFVLDPFGFVFYGTMIGIGIIATAFLYILIAILNLFEVIVVVLPPPVFQNDCQQTVSLTLAKQKSSKHKDYQQMRDDSVDGDNDYFDDTI